MCWKVALVQLLLILHHCVLSATKSTIHPTAIKPKRSPLEIGYVQFTLPPHATHHLHPVAVHVHAQNVSSVQGKLVSAPAYVAQGHWVPGYVHNHEYVPGRVHHVLVPLSVPVVAHPLLLHPAAYRKHYGGFGVGVDYGGRGAGHGYHVL